MRETLASQDGSGGGLCAQKTSVYAKIPADIVPGMVFWIKFYTRGIVIGSGEVVL